MDDHDAVKRREFLIGTGAVGVTATAVGLLGTGSFVSGTRAVSAPPEPAGTGQGYRLSEHIQKYYRSSRI